MASGFRVLHGTEVTNEYRHSGNFRPTIFQLLFYSCFYFSLPSNVHENLLKRIINNKIIINQHSIQRATRGRTYVIEEMETTESIYCVCGYHVYKNIWETAVGEILPEL